MRKGLDMANGIDQGALDANRKGRMTFSQGFVLAPYLFGGGVVFVIGAGMFYAGLYNLYNALVNHIIQNGTYIGIPMFLILGGWFSWFAWKASGKTVSDLVSGKVLSIDGYTRKHLEPTQNGRGSICYYSIDTLSFQVPSKSRWDALPDEGIVRAYYTPKSMTFINAEVLSS